MAYRINTAQDAQQYLECEWAEWDGGRWWVAREDEHTPASENETLLLSNALLRAALKVALGLGEVE